MSDQVNVQTLDISQMSTQTVVDFMQQAREVVSERHKTANALQLSYGSACSAVLSSHSPKEIRQNVAYKGRGIKNDELFSELVSIFDMPTGNSKERKAQIQEMMRFVNDLPRSDRQAEKWAAKAAEDNARYTATSILNTIYSAICKNA